MDYIYSPDPIKERLHREMHQLLWRIQESPSIYSRDVHDFLKEESVYMLGQRKRDIYLPLPESRWPDVYRDFYNHYINSRYEWPKMTHSTYALDDCISKFPGLLYFGYALCNGKIYPTAFFVHLDMTFKIEGIDDLFHEEWVFDPIALTSGKNPDCYLGVYVSPDIVENWLLSQKGHPLDYVIDLENEKHAEESRHQKELLLAEHEMLKNTPEENKKTVFHWLCQQHF